MPFKKGQSGNKKGRPKGAKNKLPNEVINKILNTEKYLEKKGLGFKKFALEHPIEFWTRIYTRIVPKEVKIDKEKTPLMICITNQHLKKKAEEEAKEEAKKVNKIE